MEKVTQRTMMPRIFVASTSESLALAETLKAALFDISDDVNIWAEGIFVPGLTNIEALELELLRADFAILLLSPDDEVTSRGTVSAAPRDNLILELGLTGPQARTYGPTSEDKIEATNRSAGRSAYQVSRRLV
ncbi:putative nucleotide-binding protein [Bradyrhizobium sp. LA6.1]|uniref:TIR domain-containing protein n=1 Tax=Bradyrhizobium sp. LA6.1 TaxID=3156378 RepID=UPI003394A017